jgi:AcrR family transcriptional regulator
VSAGPGLRQRKKDRLRDQLHRAATRLFLERGFDGTTIDAIVELAEVSRRTFFRYFEAKEDAWFGDVDGDRDKIALSVESRPATESPLRVARYAYLELLRSYETDPGLALQMARLATRTPALQAKLAYFRERNARTIAGALAKRTGHAPDDLAVTVIATNAVSTIGAAVNRWILEDGARPLQHFIDEACAVADSTSA